MTCTTFAANTPIQELMWCAIENATGSALLAAILLFIIFLYAIYTFKLPFQALVPVGIMALFFFAGAGMATNVIGGFSPFTTMMMIVVAVIGAIIMLAFWRLKK